MKHAQDDPNLGKESDLKEMKVRAENRYSLGTKSPLVLDIRIVGYGEFNFFLISINMCVAKKKTPWKMRTLH